MALMELKALQISRWAEHGIQGSNQHKWSFWISDLLQADGAADPYEDLNTYVEAGWNRLYKSHEHGDLYQ